MRKCVGKLDLHISLFSGYKRGRAGLYANASGTT